MHFVKWRDITGSSRRCIGLEFSMKHFDSSVLCYKYTVFALTLYAARHCMLPDIVCCQTLYAARHWKLPDIVRCQTLYAARHCMLPDIVSFMCCNWCRQLQIHAMPGIHYGIVIVSRTWHWHAINLLWRWHYASYVSCYATDACCAGILECWVLTCLTRWCFWRNWSGQWGQGNGRSPVWVHTCFSRFCCCAAL